MRAVIQRVLSAEVRVAGERVGGFAEPGLLVYLGVAHDDGALEIAWTPGSSGGSSARTWWWPRSTTAR